MNHGLWEPGFNHESGTNVGSGHKGWTEIRMPPAPPPFPYHGVINPVVPTFNDVHSALIPVGPYRGCVVTFDYVSNAVQQFQRYTIIDPNGGISIGGVNYTFVNRWIPMPPGEGDLFCPGMAWDKRGRLFVAGGTTGWPDQPGGPNLDFMDDPLHPNVAPPWQGGRMVWLSDPVQQDPNNPGVFGVWSEIRDALTQAPAPMQKYRWYPTVTFDHNDRMIITSGIHNAVLDNTYEAMTVPLLPGHWAQGIYDAHSDPPNPLYPAPIFEVYPRFHLLSDGSLFYSGFFGNWARKEHPLPPVMGTWSVQTGPTLPVRYYGSSFLMPNQAPGPLDVVVRTGGRDGAVPSNVTETTEYFNPLNATWVPYNNMHEKRHTHNTVPLPDGTVLVIGGNRAGRELRCTNMAADAVFTPELLTPAGWVNLVAAQHTSPRVYHSTALILPDGRVIVLGGECRTKDIEIYKPPYLTGGRPRPTGVQVSSPTLNYDSLYNVTFNPFSDEEPLVTVSKVVLIRPGAVTHHTDMDTRYIELISQPGPASSRTFLSPKDSKAAPRGYYMLFLVTNEKVPSVASWVHLGG